MIEVSVTMYKCDFCGKLFERKRICIEHERLKHKCPICEHVTCDPIDFYTTCELKRCSFKLDRNRKK